jgi:Protein of unknown function DUF262
MMAESSGLSVVQVRPEVLFLSELLRELRGGSLRIPRFQRPFIWRRDQMTDLLDSVYMQYPIGSILVWETDVAVATLARLGPLTFPETPEVVPGYVLDGHQRLSTLAGALLARDDSEDWQDEDPGRWDLVWNIETGRFQHGHADDDPAMLFPLTSLLDTLQFLQAVERVRNAAHPAETADSRVSAVSLLARAFQEYRVPVIRIRKTGLTEAVEIFARLNSKGQAMSADQMVSALSYREGGGPDSFDLAAGIDEIAAMLGEHGFEGFDRTAILRAILANMGEDIYKTDWTRMAEARRKPLVPRLKEGAESALRSMELAVEFLWELGVKVGRLLPYAMQLVTLSAFFDVEPDPSAAQVEMLARWFWVSSFSGWFGGANPSRVNALIAEFREHAASGDASELKNFDLRARSLPYPKSFDMRSARTRTLLLVMLALEPRGVDGSVISEPWRTIAEKGPDGVGYIVGSNSAAAAAFSRDPANRMIRPPQAATGSLRYWIEKDLTSASDDVLASHALTRRGVETLVAGDVAGFIEARREAIIDAEVTFRSVVGVVESSAEVGDSPIDTE